MKANPGLAAGAISTAVYTSPHATADLDPLPALLAMVSAAKTSIYFSVYAFTLSSLSALIIEKHSAGLTIQGVADASEYGEDNAQAPVLAAAGVDLRVWGSTWNLNHEKVFVVDGERVSLGSFNFTTQSEKSNKEVLLIMSGKQVEKILAPTLTAQIQATYAAGTVPPDAIRKGHAKRKT
jgi:phosphatidylserine/phosphatidylglycerophosphate/cardiolipin synthase-like enzyme